MICVLKQLEAVLNEVGDESVIIVYHHRAIRAELERRLPGIKDVREAGVIDDWNSGKLKYMMLHPKSASHGLNLQDGGRNMVFFQLSYSREDYDQTIGRLSRQGQKRQVRIWRILCENTIDIDIKNSLYGKWYNQEEFLQSLNSNIKRRLKQ